MFRMPSYRATNSGKVVRRVNRGAGTGLMGGGVVLIGLGAILYWGITVHTAGWFNFNNIGLILFWLGIATFVAGSMVVAFGGRSKSTMHEDIHSTPGGQSRTEEREDWSNTA